MPIFTITSYAVSFNKDVCTINGKNYNRLAHINARGPNQPTDIVKFCNINFITDAEVSPPNALPSNTTTMIGAQYIVTIFYPASCYAWFLDLLRNEKPVSVEFWTEPNNAFKNRIQTGFEPIGEAE